MLKKICVQMSFLLLLSLLLTMFVFTSTTAFANDMFAMVGFATMNGGTTGGQGGIVKYVSTGSEIASLISQKKKGTISEPLTIYVQGTITPSNSSDSKIDIKEVKDISIIGVGTEGEFNGIGIKITKSSNIIIQNLKIHNVNIGDKDCISIEGPANNIWVDHCELYNDLDHSKDYYDGLLDAKAESEYITYSWNYLHDSYKSALVGSSDSDNFDRKITMHHNRIENCFSRLPLYRYGTGHIFNNYYAGIIDTGANSRMGAKLKIENNYFENSKDPIGFWYSDETGYWDVSGNEFVNCTGSQPTSSTCSFSPPYSYSNLLHTASQAKALVLQYAGIGKLDGSATPVIPTSTIQVPTQTPSSTNPPSGVVYGDLNGDNSANSLDFASLRLYLLGSGYLSDNQLKAADLNLDGGVNSIDFGIFRQFLLGIINKLPYSQGSTSPTPYVTPSVTNTPTVSDQPIEGDIILEPNGSMSLQQAIEAVQPGKTIYLKSGTYSYSTSILIAEGNNGTSSARKTISAYGNDKPVIDFSAMAWGSANRGIVLAGNYWHIKGIKIQKAGDNGMLLSGHYNIIDTCDFYANGDTGLQLSRYNTSYDSINEWPSNNLIQDCYSHSNYDQDNGEDADGFAAKLTCGQNNKFIRCVAKYNVDDGWDLYTKNETGPIGSVYFEDCEASNNGKTESGQSTSDSDGNGFKLGGSKISVDHKLVNCKAYNNKKHGFTWNSNPGNLVLIGCEASGNGGNDFEKVSNQ